MKVFVLAAGYGTRGRMDFPMNKLAFKINGEPLLSRTFRLLKSNGLENIYAIVRNKDGDNDINQTKENVDIIPNDVHFIFSKGDHKNSFIELKNTMPYWDDDVFIIFGDLVFSDKALKYMLTTWKGDFTVFGWGSKEGVTKPIHHQFCDHGEVFAFKIRKNYINIVKSMLSALPLKYYDAWNIVYGLKIPVVQVGECKDLDSKADMENTPKMFKGL